MQIVDWNWISICVVHTILNVPKSQRSGSSGSGALQRPQQNLVTTCQPVACRRIRGPFAENKLFAFLVERRSTTDFNDLRVRVRRLGREASLGRRFLWLLESEIPTSRQGNGTKVRQDRSIKAALPRFDGCRRITPRRCRSASWNGKTAAGNRSWAQPLGSMARGIAGVDV
jgi:hypothetical protein